MLYNNVRWRMYRIILIILGIHYCESIEDMTVPSDLLLGTATSAYQVERAWNSDGKGENIWDRMTHSFPNGIVDGSTADIACDSYHKTKEDVKILQDLGVQFYRFSLSWSRILPTGFSNNINKAGIDYYNELIDELLANSITPVVTLFHWDLPQPLQDLGGFANPEIVVWFKYYAHVAFKHFGDRVKMWITINEPKQICEFGYGIGDFAPSVESNGIGTYICTYNLLRAHAQAYHLYDNMYRSIQKGTIGITIEMTWCEPLTNSTADIQATERKRQFDFGLYTNPIYHKNGDYPEIVKEFVARRSKAEGFRKSRLPEFTLEEIKYIKGTSDYFGMNHYTTVLVKDKEDDPVGVPSQHKDMRIEWTQNPDWLTGSFPPFKLFPWGFRQALNYVKNNYGNPDIYITENGFSDVGELEDTKRIRFYMESLKAVLDAIQKDNVQVKAYTTWSFLDNYEWINGYTTRFGLIHVNFTDPNRTRTPKASAKFYKELIRTRKLVITNP